MFLQNTTQHFQSQDVLASALAAAISAEQARTHWLGEAADRLFSHNYTLSRALNDFHQTSLSALEVLRSICCQMALKSVLDLEQSASSYRQDFNERFAGEDEFFILNDTAARRLLKKLCRYSHRVASYFRQAATRTLAEPFFDLLIATAERLEYQASKFEKLAKPFRLSRAAMSSAFSFVRCAKPILCGVKIAAGGSRTF